MKPLYIDGEKAELCLVTGRGDTMPATEEHLAYMGYVRGAPSPLPIRLVCERCNEIHIDEGEFATKPHHTHACQHCGHVWRPAVFPTVGVRFLPGFKNEPT